jgi:hypothetical protein
LHVSAGLFLFEAVKACFDKRENKKSQNERSE